jgi:hypothetical protein
LRKEDKLMPENPYFYVRSAVERRLSKPYAAMRHIALFTVCAFIGGVITLLRIDNPAGFVDGGIWFFTALWSIVLGAHVGRAYLRSGTWTNTRETVLEEEMLKAQEIYNLSADDMIDLHQRISEEVAQRTKPVFNPLALVAGVDMVLWLGMLFLVMIVSRVLGEAVAVFSYVQFISLVGTLAIGLTLPFNKALRQPRTVDDLRAVYGSGGKRKRQPEDYESDVIVDDAGELVYDKRLKRD